MYRGPGWLVSEKTIFKRQPLALSALAGALALAGSGALADGKPVPIKLLQSGKFEVLAGYAPPRQSFEKSSDADGDGTTHYGALDILSSSEIHVTGSTPAGERNNRIRGGRI